MPFKQYRVVFFPCQAEGGPSLPQPRLAQVRVNSRQALIDFVGVGEKTEFEAAGGTFVGLANDALPVNATVAAILQHGGTADANLRGNVILYKPDPADQNLPTNLSVEEVKAVMKLHQTIQAERKASSAKNKKQKKAQDARPKAARARFVEVFKPQYLKSLGDKKPSPEDLSNAIKQAWESLPEAERAPYEEAYKADLAAYKLEHPEPPVRPRSAHILYSSEHKVIGTVASQGFKALSENEQNRYRKLALEDKERYQREFDAYIKWCETKGVAVPEKVARGQKKKADPKPTGEEPSRKRTKQAERKQKPEKSGTETKTGEEVQEADKVVEQPEPALADMQVEA